MTVTIYALVDPRTDAIRYVGQTTRPLDARLTSHLYETHNGPKWAWLQELKGLELQPRIIPLDTVLPNLAPARERYWINHYTAAGFDLLNGAGADSAEGVTPAKVTTAFHLIPEAKRLLRELSDRLGVPQAGILELLIREKARREKIE